MGPQLRGSTFGEGNASCALGSALLAIGITDAQYTQVFRHFPLSLELHGNCSILNGIRERNDCKGWTREQIADWVETIEAQNAA